MKELCYEAASICQAQAARGLASVVQCGARSLKRCAECEGGEEDVESSSLRGPCKIGGRQARASAQVIRRSEMPTVLPGSQKRAALEGTAGAFQVASELPKNPFAAAVALEKGRHRCRCRYSVLCWPRPAARLSPPRPVPRRGRGAELPSYFDGSCRWPLAVRISQASGRPRNPGARRHVARPSHVAARPNLSRVPSLRKRQKRRCRRKDVSPCLRRPKAWRLL